MITLAYDACEMLLPPSDTETPEHFAEATRRQSRKEVSAKSHSYAAVLLSVHMGNEECFWLRSI